MTAPSPWCWTPILGVAMNKPQTEVIGLLKENCYLLAGQTGALVIDPGEATPAVMEFCETNRDKSLAVLLTHAHFDHILGAGELKERFGATVMIGEPDAPGLEDPRLNLCGRLRLRQKTVVADRLLQDGDVVRVGDWTVQVLSTPGHTKGGVCYRIKTWLFSGDTLFAGSFGRTDFPGGDAAALLASLERLFDATTDCDVFPGHGEPTTLFFEKNTNPYKRFLHS